MTQGAVWVLAGKTGFHTGTAYGINGSELYKLAEPTTPNRSSMVELKRLAVLVAAKAAIEERDAQFEIVNAELDSNGQSLRPSAPGAPMQVAQPYPTTQPGKVPAQPSQNKERSMREWFDSDNNIIVDTLPELMSAASTRQFGETKAETLARFLMCEALERRYVPEEALAFRLAAMIISRIETQPAAPGTAGDS